MHDAQQALQGAEMHRVQLDGLFEVRLGNDNLVLRDPPGGPGLLNNMVQVGLAAENVDFRKGVEPGILQDALQFLRVNLICPLGSNWSFHQVELEEV